ncbi:MAG: nuclear transport factor 2 family protein [Actinomycetota bacterium]
MNDWLIADAQTRSLAHRYALALDQRDIASMSALFASDARFGRYGVGPDGAREFYSVIPRRFSRSVHTVGTQVVNIHDDATSASGIVYCRAEQQDPETQVWTTLQFAYHDEYVLEGDRWLFRARAPKFWYRESEGVRTIADDATAIPTSWETWRRYFDLTD